MKIEDIKTARELEKKLQQVKECQFEKSEKPVLLHMVRSCWNNNILLPPWINKACIFLIKQYLEAEEDSIKEQIARL